MQGSSYGDEVGGPEAAPGVTGILFVCTANQCRSAMAEAIARRRFAGLPFAFASAGLIEGGHPMPPAGLQVARENGFDLSGHLSRRADRRRLGAWDVILTMSRQHVRELVAADAELWPRVFTLPQFVRWLDEHPPRRHVLLGEWIDLAAEGRPRSDMIGSSDEDDIADPVDQPPEAWRVLVAELTRDIDRLAAHLVADRGTAAASGRARRLGSG
ncbi:low molecular weight protein arginine phosphatase [Humibacter antri]